MIPAHMLHEAERTRTRAEQRATDLRRSELAAAFARLGSVVMGPLHALGRLSQGALTALTAGRTAPPARKSQRLDRVGSSAARSFLHSCPRWWTFEASVPADGHLVSDETPFGTPQ